MKTIIIAISLLAAVYASGQDHNLQEIRVTAPHFRSELYDNLNDFLLSGIEYQHQSIRAGNEGTEVIRFVVTPRGEVKNLVVINSVSQIIDLEMLRILEITNGKWTPGTVNNVPVAMEKEISVVFKISENSDFVEKAKYNLEIGNNLFFVHNRPEKALKYFDKGISLLPYNETLLAVRGLCKYENGDLEGAKSDWNRLKKIVEKKPNELPAIKDVSYTQLIGYQEMMAIVNN
jgi:tetratricopeptide (TPR) repeat protein